MRFSIVPLLKRALPMGKRKARVGAGEGWIESHGNLEKPLGSLVLGLREAVHMPKAAVIGLPCVERVGRLQHGAVALDCFDFARNRRNNLRSEERRVGKE